ncbi:MAG: hypothetical protein V4643_06390 [Bacteroidota bacterium]
MEGKLLTQVYYHFWVNKSKPDDVFSFVEYIELLMKDGSTLVLQKAEDNDMILPLAAIDIPTLNAQLMGDFNGQLQYQSRNAGKTKAWEHLVNTTINDVLVEEENGRFSAEIITIGNKNNQTVIRLENDGLEAEEYIID